MSKVYVGWKINQKMSEKKNAVEHMKYNYAICDSAGL